MNKVIFILTSCLFSSMSMGQIKLTIPMEGESSRDYIIVNHVDQDTTEKFIDHKCGTKSYNGHYGTDFTLKNFLQMDSGVYILAAADGVVFRTHDGEFDRNKEPVISRGFGNWIGIRHASNGSNFYSYYAHLKTGSLLVDSGDVVKAGDRIALVGSSGNSTDPHLHFEIWNDSAVLDPWDGPCQFTPNGNLWENPIPYDTSFLLWNYGTFETDESADFDTIREPYFPYHISTDSTLIYGDKSDFKSLRTEWILCKGVRKGDVVSSYWLNKDGDTMGKLSYVAERDFWYFYYWTTLDVSLLGGADEYPARVVFSKNGVPFYNASHKRVVDKQGHIRMVHDKPKLLLDGSSVRILVSDKKNPSVKVYNSLGQLVHPDVHKHAHYMELNISSSAAQWYIIHLFVDGNAYYYKWYNRS